VENLTTSYKKSLPYSRILMLKTFQVFTLFLISTLFADRLIYFVPQELIDRKVEMFNLTTTPCTYQEMVAQILNGTDYRIKNFEAFRTEEEIERVILYNLPKDSDCLQLLSHLPKEKKVIFLWEPPIILPKTYKKENLEQFGKVFTWDDDLVDNVKFFKFHYPVHKEMIKDLTPFEKKSLCTTIISMKASKHKNELYSERKKAIEYFEKNHSDDFRFYGVGWEKANFKTYNGTVKDKIETLKNYRFCICYENMCNIKGYITEKIFDAFAAGCIPIYWGASNVEDYIPTNCFIDKRKFKNYDELYSFIKNMNKSDYESHLSHIRDFLDSDRSKLFSCRRFAEQFVTQAIKDK